MHHPTDRITHTTAFDTPVVEPGRKEGNVLFNDALNNFIYGYMERRHMVKDHTDSERGNAFRLAARIILYAQTI